MILLILYEIPYQEPSKRFYVLSVCGSEPYMFRSLSGEQFLNALLKKVLKLVPLTSTGPEVYVAMMTIFLSSYYDTLDETLNHLNSLKLNRYTGGGVSLISVHKYWLMLSALRVMGPLMLST